MEQMKSYPFRRTSNGYIIMKKDEKGIKELTIENTALNTFVNRIFEGKKDEFERSYLLLYSDIGLETIRRVIKDYLMRKHNYKKIIKLFAKYLIVEREVLSKGYKFERDAGIYSKITLPKNIDPEVLSEIIEKSEPLIVDIKENASSYYIFIKNIPEIKRNIESMLEKVDKFIDEVKIDLEKFKINFILE